MKKYLISLLCTLAILPLLNTDAVNSITTSTKTFSDIAHVSAAPPQYDFIAPKENSSLELRVISLNFDDMDFLDDVEIKLFDDFVMFNSYAYIYKDSPQITKDLLSINSLIGVINARTELLNGNIENIWIPKSKEDFPISEQMLDKVVDANSLVITFEELTRKSIIENQGLLNSSEPKYIRTPYEFKEASYIRAHTNIDGINFTGPVIYRYDLNPTEKKMSAAYGLIGEIIASRLFLVSGSWDNRTTLQIPDSSALFTRRSGDARTSGTFLGQETDLIDYTGTSSDGVFQVRTVVEKVVDFLRRIMVPIAVLLVAYSGIELFLSFQNEERMAKKIRQLTGVLVGFLGMALAINIVDWVVFGSEGQLLRGDVDVATFARHGLSEISGLFDLFTSFAVIIAVAFIVFNAITLILAGGEDESEIATIKKRILYSLIGIILMISARPLINVFTSDSGQLVMPEVRGTITIIAKWVNFIIGFIGVFAVAAMIYAGIQMIVHFGDDTQVESAKKTMTAAAIGLILALSSWVVVYYFVFAGQV